MSVRDQEFHVKLVPGGFQHLFLESRVRYPALISGIGTGKTFMLLLKVWKFLESYPGSLGLLVRKEYTDLRDSTIKDFTRYFGVVPDSNKEYRFSNGSVLMFRHADETAVLKNINLSIFGIEQAEEFETEEQFIYLRDRLRNKASPYRQGVVIANAHGHNWIWRRWINNPPDDEHKCWQATTFDNQENLPADFIADLRRMEKDAPNHYMQYVMNSHEEVDASDVLLRHEAVYQSPALDMAKVAGRRVLAVDVARYGDDECVFTILERRGLLGVEQIHQDIWRPSRDRSVPNVAGHALHLRKTFACDVTVIDDDGVGGGVTDLVDGALPFHANQKVTSEYFTNLKSESYFRVKELVETKQLKLLPDMELAEQLLTIRYEYKGDKKNIVSKEIMRKQGLKSPDRADALMMAVAFLEHTPGGADDRFSGRLPPYALADEDVSGFSERAPNSAFPPYARTD